MGKDKYGQEVSSLCTIRKPGVVIAKSGYNDYNVRVNEDEYRRNRQFLRDMNPELPCKERSLHQDEDRQKKEYKKKIDKTPKERFSSNHTDSMKHSLNKKSIVTRSSQVIK
ncbi:hypothetical protein FQA39_LY02475 [Lamprigera yunnana]|nr:hypothetical protein FQA39_LY02475 [Lamprigera yunnana]